MKRLQPISTADRHHSSAFTIMELLLVVVLIGIVTTLAVPSMRSVVRRHQDLDVASNIATTINKIRDQATRRNKAYQVIVSEMNAATPQGRISVFEASGSGCQSLIARPAQVHAVDSFPFGMSGGDQERPIKDKNVGILGWRIGVEQAFNEDEQTYCFSSNGALYKFNGGTYTPVSGVLNLAVQSFIGDRAWSPFGPPIIIELSFSSGAQLQRK